MPALLCSALPSHNQMWLWRDAHQDGPSLRGQHTRAHTSPLQKLRSTAFPSTDHTKGYWAPKVARAVWNTGSPFVLFCLEQHVVPLHQALISAPGTPQGMGWDNGCPQAAPQGFSSVLVPACCLRGSRRYLWWHPVHISMSLFLGQIIVTTHSLLT